MSCVIRKAVADDIPLLTGLIRKSFKDVAVRFGITRENCPSHPAFTDDHQTGRFMEQGGGFLIVEEDTGPCGCAGLVQDQAGVWSLVRLAVMPQFRRRGIGRKLVNAIETEARRNGARRLELGIIAAHTELEKWYLTLGFLAVRTFKVNHLPFEVTIMGRDLACSEDDEMPRSQSLFRLDGALRKEADELLNGRGLRELLARYGTLHIIGSYLTQLMVWRDLDLCIESPDMTVGRFFEMGREIAGLLSPWKMFFTDHRTIAHESGLRGLYWGIRLGDIRSGAFKIDLWALDVQAIQRQVEHGNAIVRRLTSENRSTILSLKSQVWDCPEYRDTLTSQDIYDAVLGGGVVDVAGLRQWKMDKSR